MRVQKPVYFTSKALKGAEEWYPRIEKLELAIVVLARRMRPYFQGHLIRVLIEHPLKKILQRPDISGRMVNWVIEIGEFNINFLPRMAINGQALVDFLADFSGFLEDVGLPDEEVRLACVDGSSTRKRSGVGRCCAHKPGRRAFGICNKTSFHCDQQ
jgi:hypothetical protein